MATQEKGTSAYSNAMSMVEHYRKQLDDLSGGLNLEVKDGLAFSSLLDDRVAVLAYFEAARLASISHADTAKGVISEQERYKSVDVRQKLSGGLEQHLVNLRNRRSLALTEDNDKEFAAKILTWFHKFESDLKELMEDASTKLEFDSDRLKFTIAQTGKVPYTFQTLSSGYLAIFDIYADLLMRTEYFKVLPEELVGLVFIDELDAHLHVSLQRLILPFLTRSFPLVQFVVTTHSPFVIMSVDDAVIFDIGRNQQVDEDLSLYSYSAVMEGVLGTRTTSKLLDEIISRIASIVNSGDVNSEELSGLLEKIRPVEGKLDSQSRAFYMKGMNALLDEGEV
ncbi:ATP-binding protein [Pseudomonas sp. CVAP|uniref:AAA family ATPase n=1 Tax=Pseudomonas sp. CVAP\|nr:AAA family ATPase [Pseudomonas sp. CVAP\